MKKTWKNALHFLVISLMLGTTISPLAVMANEEADPYTEEAVMAHDKAMEKIEVAKETKDLEDIQAAYEAFVLITPEMNPQNFGAYLPEDQMDQVYYEISELLYETTPKKQREDVVLEFANAWFEVLMENTNSLYTHHFSHMVENNTLKNIQSELEELVNELSRYVYGTPSEDGIIPLPTEEEMEELVEEFFEEYGQDEEDPDRATEEEVENELNEEFEQLDGNEVGGQTIRYEKVDGEWYEITETIQDGKIIKTDRRLMTLEESYFLRVQEDPYYDPYNKLESVQYVTDREWDYYTTDQNIESRYTIHYTVNKDETNPYYYDTGMRVNENKAATYEQYRDVLTLLAEKAEGHTVNDKTKTLAVLEGKPIVIHDSKEFYSKSELETLFEDFERVDIRIMETSIGQAGSLEESIVSKNANKVEVNGSEITLETDPIVKSNRVLLPLREIATALGGNVSQNADTYTVQKGTTQVVFRTDDKSVYVNGKRIELNNPPVFEGDVLMVEVGELATALNYNMTWESDTSTLNFQQR